MAVMKSNTSSVYFTNASHSKAGIKREKLSFTNLDAGLIVFSMVTIVAHLVTDTILVATYFLTGHSFWATCTVALALVPSFIIQAFSLRWHVLDNAASLKKWLSHSCLLGIFFRHVDALETGLEARRSGDVANFQSLFHQQSDISMLQLFESFMKSAPQLVLQIYIMIQVRDWGPWTGLSAGASLVSLAWAMAAYTHAMRQARPDKQKASLPGLLLQAIWRAGLLVARITALVLFAICCQAWLFLLLGLQWLGMTVWVVLQKTDLCSSPWEECAYNCVVGVVYCFCFFNLREGRARGRMLAFYVVTVTQNLACLYLFLALSQHTHPVLATISAGAVVGGTIIGLCAMLAYYRFFHPSGPIMLFGPPNLSLNTLSQSSQNIERNNGHQLTMNQAQVASDVSSQLSQAQDVFTQPSQMPSDVEKSNSLRSLKHLWSIDRDGSLSSRSDDVPPHGGSPHPDDGYTDKRLLLSSKGSTRRPTSTDSHQVSTTPIELSKQSNLTAVSGQSSGHSHSSICNQSGSGVSNLTSRTTLNSQCHQSPTSNRRSSQSLHVAISTQSVHSTNTTHSGHSSFSNHSSVVNRTAQTVRPVTVEEKSTQGIDVDDSKISWNCTSMMEDTQPSEVIENLTTELEANGACNLNKRRGICSSVELGLDMLEEEETGSDSPSPDNQATRLHDKDDSFARLCERLVANVEVKQLSGIESVKKVMESRLRDLSVNKGKEVREEKRESDYIDSKQSAISSDGASSEVLSAHDYENICAVNIAREAWGLRSWRGYSDIETWLHDDSVVRDRRRDTLASIGTTTTMTSASSERSTNSESPPPLRQQWENSDTGAPPLPCRRPRNSYSRMDDYLDTLAFDLAEIEQREGTPNNDNRQGSLFTAQPYVVDQNGMLYPLPSSLDTILEELEESSVSASTVTAVEDGSTTPGWASSLVATIDEIRMNTCTNTLEDSGTVSESDFEVGSYRSLQLESSMTNHRCLESPIETCRSQQCFSNSLPSLLQAPRSWSHLTPEEVLFLSELKPQQETELRNESNCFTVNVNNNDAVQRKNWKRPRRKFSLLREKFELKCEKTDLEADLNDHLRLNQDNRNFKNCIQEPAVISSNISSKLENHLKRDVKVPVATKNDVLHINNSSALSSLKDAELKGSGWAPSETTLSFRGQTLFQPKLVPHSKKLSLDSNASA